MRKPFFDEAAVIAIAVHTIGMFFILSATAMFVKQRSLHSVEHVHEMNLLLCGTLFLLEDWILIIPTHWQCHTFSLVYIVFGSACTFSVVGIAFERYKKMLGLTDVFSHRNRYLLELLIVWMASLLLIAYPVSLRIMHAAANQDTHLERNTSAVQQGTICFFTESCLYASPVTSLSSLLGAVVIPVCLMLYFYTKIFQRIRKARLDRWINRVAFQRSRETRVIQCAGRKANVFQVTPAHPNDNNIQRFNRLSHTREKSVLLKGIFAIGVVLLCWLPYTSVWVFLSIDGFRQHYIDYIVYLMIETKLSVVFNVAHYICFNVKYRNLYLQTICVPFTKFLPSPSTDNNEDTTQFSSRGRTTFRKSIFTTRSSGRILIEPIREQYPTVQIQHETSDVISEPRSISGRIRHISNKSINSVSPAKQSNI